MEEDWQLEIDNFNANSPSIYDFNGQMILVFSSAAEYVIICMRRKIFHRIPTIVEGKKIYSLQSQRFILFEKEENKLFRFSYESFEEQESENKLDQIVLKAKEFIHTIIYDESEAFFTANYNYKDCDKYNEITNLDFKVRFDQDFDLEDCEKPQKFN